MYLVPSTPILVISWQKLNGLSEHWGVQLHDRRVAHYSAEHHFQMTSVEEFAQGKDVTIVRVVPSHLSGTAAACVRQIAQQPCAYHTTE